MRAIASGLTLCWDYGCRDYGIAWPVNDDLRCDIGELFESNEYLEAAFNVSAANELWFYDIPRKKNLYLSSVAQLGRYGCKLTDWDNLPEYDGEPRKLTRELEKCKGTVLIRSGVIFYPFEEDFYRALFKPRASIINEAESRLAVAGGRCVGLHVRRTDNVVSIEHSPLSLFIDAIGKELESDPSTVFYLATDDPGVKAELADRFGAARFICTDKKVVRNTPEGIREALTEIIALSKCVRVYGSYWSSFSEASAMLGDIPLIQLKK